MRITEVDLYVGSHREAPMVSHLFAAIPRQRFESFRGKFAGVFDQGADDRLGILTDDFHQHYLACMTLNKNCNLAVPATAQQLTSPNDLAPPDL